MSSTPITDAANAINAKTSPATSKFAKLVAAKIEPPAPPPPPPPPAPPPPPPPAGVGFWDATQATVAANSAALIAHMLATAGPAYFSAGVARATADATTPAYAVPTQEQTASVTMPIPPGTQPGHTFDRLLVVTGPDGTRYSLGGANYDSASRRISGCFGATITAPGKFSEPRPNSSSAARLPFGYITPEDVQNNVMAALTFSTANTGSGAAVYPADTSYPGNGTGLPYGSWVRLPSGLALDPALTPFENYVCRRLQACGAFLRDVGSSFMFYGSDQVNQGGQAHDWAAVGVVLEATNAGYPYAHRFSAAFVGMLQRLELLLPPAVA